MEQNITLIWDNCLSFMRDNLNSIEEKEGVNKLDDSFDLLFSKVKPVSLLDKNLTLQVPSDFYREYIEDNYLSLLSAALKKNIGKGCKALVFCNGEQTGRKSSASNYTDERSVDTDTKTSGSKKILLTLRM